MKYSLIISKNYFFLKECELFWAYEKFIDLAVYFLQLCSMR